MPLNPRCLSLSLLLLLGGAAAAEPLLITREDCARLVPHTPASGTEFLPGRDVRGGEVTPADLPDGRWQPEGASFLFDLEIRPLDKPGFEETSLSLGRVLVTRDGVARIDGVPLQSEPAAALRELCRGALQP